MNVAAEVHIRDDGYMKDTSSQAVAAAVPVSPGGLVLDACAAPGGKATAIAGTGARVIAADSRHSRAGLIVANRRRLDLDDLHVVQADGAAPPYVDTTFDAVLVDAPCSGLGALRRRADARWRIRPGDVDELADLQQRILLASAPLVKLGGSLVYSVCTLTKAESVDVVAATAGALAALGFRADLPADGDWEPYGPDTLVVVPGAATDGMALARWRRA